MNSVLTPEGPETDLAGDEVCGEYIDMHGDRFYVIRNVQKIAPFLIRLVSAGYHWLIASSTGGLTAGRVSP